MGSNQLIFFRWMYHLNGLTVKSGVNQENNSISTFIDFGSGFLRAIAGEDKMIPLI